MPPSIRSEELERHEPPVKDSPRILVVDDSQEILTMLSHALSRHGFLIDAATSTEEALARLATETYDAAVVDLVMPGQDGAALAAALRERIQGLPVALMTAYARSPLLVAARKAGARVFPKPLSIQDLVGFLKSEIP
jgi:DNA-binding response OmpR family regulator